VGRYLLLHLPLYPAAEGRQELELLNGNRVIAACVVTVATYFL